MVLNCHENGVNYILLRADENLIPLKGSKTLIRRGEGYLYHGPFYCKVAFPLLSIDWDPQVKLRIMSEYATFLEFGISVNDMLCVNASALTRLIQNGSPKSITLTPGQHSHFLRVKPDGLSQV